jgi:integrase
MMFTEEAIADLALPAGKNDLIVFDDKLPGFGVRLRSSGSRAWVVQYRIAHRQRRESLGDVRKVTLEDARKIARKRFAQVELGVDPAGDKATARAQAEAAKLTLAVVAARYLAFKKDVLRPSTYKAAARYFALQWKALRHRPVNAIKRADVAAGLQEITEAHGRTSAARARGHLSALFGWAMREGLCESNPVIATNDPAAGIKSRDRVLADEELRVIWNACRDDDFGRIIKLLILTGCRREEIGALRWPEIDLDRGVLTVPGARTKNGRPLILTLPPLALSILESAPRREGRDFVFGARGGAFSAWSYSTLVLGARITEAEGKPLAPWRIHDIRRSVATHMAEIGVQPHIIEAVLNHVSGHKAGVAGTYNRAAYEREIRAALALWADHVRSVVEGGERKVVAFARSTS